MLQIALTINNCTKCTKNYSSIGNDAYTNVGKLTLEFIKNREPKTYVGTGNLFYGCANDMYAVFFVVTCAHNVVDFDKRTGLYN